ncbi:uncharacterized protein BXZ73DRAFT_51069 [Epithele typhae]|uniref:uncharacterized protein n=1 Tax=Epithele typhae TaxID=378194 RepID=UPI00200828BD|nr:uncharacterized protein BXZ73DRAFT_51069 [Epithele typhae]KAH9923209.1 hypothetical protein BXZ73DRAFT_51069 [Epithele typhae]
MAGPSSLLLLSPVGSPTDSDSDADDDGLEFTAVDSFHGVQSQDGSRYSVDLSALIHHGTTRIFRGTLSADGIPYTEVVCKVGTGPRLVERIRHEARLYRTKLAPLQGRFVPRCFGLFEGVVEGVETSCLVLSYEGEPTQHSLHTTGIDFRRKAVSALQALHKVGVAHGDFNERSIVLRPTSCPVLVGFGGAVEHCCNLGHPIKFYEPQPQCDDVACDELYWACVMSAVWLPGVCFHSLLRVRDFMAVPASPSSRSHRGVLELPCPHPLCARGL